MPHGDHTGPGGTGPGTGRGAGLCSGNKVPGFANPGSGFGVGFGGRFGRGGRRSWNYAGQPVPFQPYITPPEMTRENEIQMLSQQADQLKTTFENIQARLDELKQKQSNEGG